MKRMLELQKVSQVGGLHKAMNPDQESMVTIGVFPEFVAVTCDVKQRPIICRLCIRQDMIIKFVPYIGVRP